MTKRKPVPDNANPGTKLLCTNAFDSGGRLTEGASYILQYLSGGLIRLRDQPNTSWLRGRFVLADEAPAVTMTAEMGKPRIEEAP